jgi:hypothetical protein
MEYKNSNNLNIDFYDHVSMEGLLEDPVRTKIWTAATLPNDNLKYSKMRS